MIQQNPRHEIDNMILKWETERKVIEEAKQLYIWD